MLTPIDIQNKTLKTGMGYNKKDVDDFLIQIIRSYEELYKQNVEFKEKIGTLSEGIQYYKSIETTLQKALVLAEKTSKETKEAAMMKAEALEQDARVKADQLLADAKNELDSVRNQTITLVQNYESFRLQFKKLAATQLELVEGDGFKIYAPELEKFMNGTSDDLQSEALLASINQAQEAQDSATAELEAVNQNIAESIAQLNASIAESEGALAQMGDMPQTSTMNVASAGAMSMASELNPAGAMPVSPELNSTGTMSAGTIPATPEPIPQTTYNPSMMGASTMTEPVAEPVMSQPLQAEPLVSEQSVSIGSMLQQQAAQTSYQTANINPYDNTAAQAPVMDYSAQAAASPTPAAKDGYLDELRFEGMTYTEPAQPVNTEPAGKSGDDIQFEFISTEE